MNELEVMVLAKDLRRGTAQRAANVSTDEANTYHAKAREVYRVVEEEYYNDGENFEVIDDDGRIKKMSDYR